MSVSSQERRRFWRAHFHAGARLLTDTAECLVQIEDVSLKGALFTLPADIVLGTNENCRLQLTLADGVVITLWGRAAHVEGNHVGLTCDSIDLDSITHLRRLVELNVGDPILLEEEISFLVQQEKTS